MTKPIDKLIADGLWQPIEEAPRDGGGGFAANWLCADKII